MDRLTRHELKADKFVTEVGHTVTFIEQHRSQVIRYGGLALAALLVAAGSYWFVQSRRTERQSALNDVMKVYNTIVDPNTLPGTPNTTSFRTAEEREQAIQKAFSNFIGKYSGSNEAAVATYLLGVDAADQGKIADAERYLKSAIDEGNTEYASLAKLAIADVYAAEGKTADAEKVLRPLVDSPTIVVSKGQASLTLARIIAKTKPDEARKLLEPLRTDTGVLGRMAISEIAALGLSK